MKRFSQALSNGHLFFKILTILSIVKVYSYFFFFATSCIHKFRDLLIPQHMDKNGSKITTDGNTFIYGVPVVLVLSNKF